MTDWNDLFVRTSIGETAPTGRAGGLSSPDIIPTGLNPTDPSVFTQPDNYGSYVSTEPFTQGYPNYIYVRAKNSATSDTAVGQAYLVETNPAVVLWPGGDGWNNILTNNRLAYSVLQVGPGDSNIPPGSIGVTNDPFVYVPTESGHRCLVTWLSTKAHPVGSPPPRITSMDDLVKFLIAHPNYAHHNIDIAADSTGAVTATKAFSSGSVTGNWRFGLQATNAKGFTVAFTSGEPLPGGDFVALEPTTVAQDTTVAYLTGNTQVPDNWNTYMNYTYASNGLPLKDGFQVQFVAYYNMSVGHALWEHGRPYTDFGVPEHLSPKAERGIPLGSVGMVKAPSFRNREAKA